jgi:two-component system, OmpR family, response regulator
MTTTPIPTHPRTSVRPSHSRGPGRAAVVRSQGYGADHPEWSLELDIRLRGEPDPAIVALLSDLRRLLTAGPQIGTVREPAQPAAAEIRIDVPAHTVMVSGRVVETTRLEFELLLFLAEHPGRVFSRQELLDSLWPTHGSGPRTIDVHVLRLRAKTNRALITTVRNVGYRLAADIRTEVVR